MLKLILHTEHLESVSCLDLFSGSLNLTAKDSEKSSSDDELSDNPSRPEFFIFMVQ
jgi:hypothetical protein